MPQPTAPRPTPVAERESPEPGATAPTKAADLTVNKVLAGAGAAATSAVLGSYFGATGTVFGAALGSVASTVATTLYQRSLDRTRDTIVARVRITGNRGTDLSDVPTVRLTVPGPRVSPEVATTQLHVEPALRRPRRVWLWAGVTVLVFVLGLLVVTGLEWAKGSTITTSQPGTSVGRVLGPAPAGTDDPAGTTDEDPTGSGSDADSATATPTAEPDSDDPGSGDTGRDDEGSDGTGSAEPTPSAEPTEGTARPTPSAPAGAEEGGRSGGETLPTPEVPVPAGPGNR